MAAIAFDNTYARDLEGLYIATEPERFPAPELVIANDALATELGLDPAEIRTHGADWFAGQKPIPGSTPLAQAYAGHQFGGFSPQLGDGRAVLLGEWIAPDGRRHDLQLKGSGRTPFSRGGDGRATLGPILREYLMGEAMAALGIKTTRALAAVTTGEKVYRQGPLPGAVLARVASSHLRVGTLQFFAARGESSNVLRLTNYALSRHYPDLVGAENPARALLAAVVEAQASLVASWMQIGFIHGVMNTDNTTLSGETIDYGPCAFLDTYDPETVFSSIDRGGRYAFGNQRGIGGWNLTRLAEALLPLLADTRDEAFDVANAILPSYEVHFEAYWLAGMRAKLGLLTAQDDDLDLVNALHARMHANQTDFTQFFRSLSTVLEGEAPAGFATWVERWRTRVKAEGRPFDDVRLDLDATNPVYIPRNHAVEAALESAVAGDLGPFHHLLDLVTTPYTERPGNEDFAGPAPADLEPHVTFCGT